MRVGHVRDQADPGGEEARVVLGAGDRGGEFGREAAADGRDVDPDLLEHLARSYAREHRRRRAHRRPPPSRSQGCIRTPRRCRPRARSPRTRRRSGRAAPRTSRARPVADRRAEASGADGGKRGRGSSRGRITASCHFLHQRTAKQGVAVERLQIIVSENPFAVAAAGADGAFEQVECLFGVAMSAAAQASVARLPWSSGRKARALAM